MKQKSATCSTGHGTGVLHMIDLGTWLKRDRGRLKAKQYRRRNRVRLVRRETPQVVAHQPLTHRPAPVAKVGLWGKFKSAVSRLIPRRMA